MMYLELMAIPVGYLIGAFPSAYVIGRVWGKIDIRKESDGHVSATALYRQMGLRPFILGVALDSVKGILAMVLAQLLTHSVPILIITAYVTVIGHCWPVYLKFNGGLGAVVTYGVIFGLAPVEYFIGGAVALIVLFTTHKSSLATFLLIVAAGVSLYFTRHDILMGLFPLGLIPIQLIKRFQIRKTTSQYKNELFSDLKRAKK